MKSPENQFMSQLLKGELDEPEPTLCPDEYVDVDESSKDSAIVSVDREREGEGIDPDASLQTVVTSIAPSTPKIKATTSAAHLSDEGGSGDERKDGKKDEDDEDQQGTGGEDDAAEVDADEEKSIWLKIIRYFYYMCWFIESCVISATAKLNHVSRDYRYVSRRLAVEKRALKLLFEMEESEGVNFDNEWKKHTLEKISRATVPLNRAQSNESFKKLKKDLDEKIAGVKKSATTDGLHQDTSGSPQKESSGGETTGHVATTGDQDTEDEITFVNSNAFFRLFRSLFYTIVSQSEIVCYAMVILNQMVNASLLSLPLPIMVFLWGCMSVPRPSKTFWISLITYTEAVVVAKYAFEFSVWPWIDYTDWNPVVIKGEEENKDKEILNAKWIDLGLLLFLFFHRFMLKTLGLWDLDESASREKIKQTVQKNYEEEQKESSVRMREKPDFRTIVLRNPNIRRRKALMEKQKTEESDIKSHDEIMIVTEDKTKSLESRKSGGSGEGSSSGGGTDQIQALSVEEEDCTGSSKLVVFLSTTRHRFVFRCHDVSCGVHLPSY